MEVQHIPAPAWLKLLGGLMTFGLIPVVLWWDRRNWPVRLDDDGLLLKNGRRVAWRDVRRMKRQVTCDEHGRPLAECYMLETGAGSVKVSPGNIYGADEVLGYIGQRVPPEALTPDA